MWAKDKPSGRNHPTFTEAARRAQIIECAIETIATLGYARASLAQIAMRAGISKGVIVYYFTTKEELIAQVVHSITTAAASFMKPRIAAERTATARLHAYLHSNIAYIAAHRQQMMAIIEIVLNARTEDGRLRYLPGREAADLAALEAILRHGQDDGEFRMFDLQVMAGTIRGAIDAVARLLVADPHQDGEPYARELVALFDRATRTD